MLLLIFIGQIVFSQDNQKSYVTMKSKLIPIAGFKNRDIGNPAIKGKVKVSNNGFDITAGGVDIWGWLLLLIIGTIPHLQSSVKEHDKRNATSR